METKSVAKSKTVWGMLVVLVPTISEALGVPLDMTEVTLENMNAGGTDVGEIMQMIGVVLVGWGRATAGTAVPHKLALTSKKGGS